MYRSTAAYGQNNERALPVIAVIIESRYEIHAVKIRRKLREAANGHEGTVRNTREREGAKVFICELRQFVWLLRSGIRGEAPWGSRCSRCDLPEEHYRGMTTL